MIELRSICKNYQTGDNVVRALHNVSVSFRKNEFVAILGPSGGGKTTMLNIIGGLDQYTSGDLIINGVSTVNFKDRDWDRYRNHSVGFVFQSYNLIPHQNVISNVELALTIAGISKKERTERAKAALEKVGLGDQIYKKPNQLSGGQMQRVAIARALVNNPEILLADEPTGALDTQSSLQIMELLKEVASDRLVIMVTHNPDLAEQYASRIVRIRDGEIISDTDPYKEEVPDRSDDFGKARMGLLTAFGLSLNNLMTKFTRTMLVSFAGSIGIIGIAMIMSLSNGVNKYIDDVQKNSLSSYPLTIENSDVDMTTSMMNMMGEIASAPREEGKVNETPIVSGMFNQVGSNNLRAFKKYIVSNSDRIDQLMTAIQYSYGVSPVIYKSDTSKDVIQLSPSTVFSSFMNSSFASYTYRDMFQRMIDNREILESQYEILKGRWPESYDEAVLVVYDESTISDFMTYSLGLRDPRELQDYITKMMNGEKVEIRNEPLSITLDDLLKLTFKVVIPADYYQYDDQFNVWKDMSDDKEYLKNVVDNGIELKITGIISPAPGTNSTVLSPGVAYTEDLIEHLIREVSQRPIVKQQLARRTVDVFTGKTFTEVNSDSRQEKMNFDDMVSIDENMLARAFRTNVSASEINDNLNYFMNQAMDSLISDTANVGEELTAFIRSNMQEMIEDYIAEHGAADFAILDEETVNKMIDNQLAKESTQKQIAQLEDDLGVERGYMKEVLRPTLKLIIDKYATIIEDGTPISGDKIGELINALMNDEENRKLISDLATGLLKSIIQKSISSTMGNMSSYLASAMSNMITIDVNALQNAFQFNFDEEEFSRVMMTYMNSQQNDISVDTNLRKLGYADLDNPVRIAFYLKDFDSKETFKDMIADYNKVEEKNGNNIVYTDITGILISSVSTIINAISYVLIAFVSVSLIVSSIMIAIITYISVLERTKEIGILRSLGASKGNVANVFNAETFIIGLFSGLFGVELTRLLCIPVNIIVRKVTGIPSLTAYLPWKTGIILVIISIVLTVIAGLIPSGMASRRDPVTALRTE